MGHRKVGIGRWHGWRGTGGRAIGIGPVKGRKRVALWITRGDGKREPVAYFPNNEAAQEALELLGDLAFGQSN